MKTVLIIPALNEERAIGHVLSEVPRGIYAQIIVGDNGSSDRTAEIAERQRQRRATRSAPSDPNRGAPAEGGTVGGYNNVYIDNLVDAVFLAITRDDVLGEIFNITDERLVSKREFIGAIRPCGLHPSF